MDRTQKYVCRFCSLLEELLAAYQNEPANSARQMRLATRSLFLACKLELVAEPEWEGKALFGPLGWFSFDLSENARDQRYVEHEMEQRVDREKRIRQFQERARALVEKGFAVEVPSAPDRTNLIKDVNAFCEYIDEIIEIYEMPHSNPEIHRFGKKANKLAVRIGLMCHDRKLALACHIARSEAKVPYVEKDWWDLSRVYGRELDRRPVDRWKAWQKRAQALIEASGAGCVSGSSVVVEHHGNTVAHAAHYDFFISHASEDKGDFVRPLARLLRELGAKVWYDEFALRVGDSLRRSIDRGLRDSRYGVLVLSNSFFTKDWPQNELDALVSREKGQRRVVLPIWHRIAKEEVSQYSPILADRVALISTPTNLKEIATKLIEELRSENEPTKDDEGTS